MGILAVRLILEEPKTKLLCKGFVKDNLTRAIFYMTCIKASTLKNNTKKALCRARQVGVNLSFRLQFHNYDECGTDSTDIFTIWHFFSIYGYDGNIISTRGLIINIKKHH